MQETVQIHILVSIWLSHHKRVYSIEIQPCKPVNETERVCERTNWHILWQEENWAIIYLAPSPVRLCNDHKRAKLKSSTWILGSWNVWTLLDCEGPVETASQRTETRGMHTYIVLPVCVCLWACSCTWGWVCSSELLDPFNAGTPIVRINRNALVLEGPSDASRKKSEEVCMYVNCEHWLALCVCVCVCVRVCVRT